MKSCYPQDMRRLLPALVVLACLIVTYFVLRPRVLWLDSFEGVVVSRAESPVTIVESSQTAHTSTYHLEVETDGGRRIRVEVDSLLYFQARRGCRVSKPPFSQKLHLIGGSQPR
ncbi:MAG: hypothetical protein JXR96_23180 [Deltaproteobacteria bacterium]|nr:hypothetical protein [Deltaproteobacteria bacterium]